MEFCYESFDLSEHFTKNPNVQYFTKNPYRYRLTNCSWQVRRSLFQNGPNIGQAGPHLSGPILGAKQTCAKMKSH